ncbi:MAG TPA: cobyrinate a,c-diamide synthase [Acidimicrobiales bacterium]|nr:cobyrinate a,c-diamide synthase [Acidimicrobiales bacterium]
MTALLPPRLVVAGTSSGVGKTTVATGLMAAFRRRGVRVAAAKVGPDFIDPGYHALATGRPGRNLDAWICGAEAVSALAGRAGRGAELLIVEGVMGLFDGAADDGGTASTAQVARLLDAPVVLVVDASSMSGSVAALVHGFATFDPRLRLAGVVLNRVGSDGHEVMLREALGPLGVPVLGVLRRDPAWAWRDRHLGLVPVAEHRDEVARSLDALADAIDASCDLGAFEALAATAPSSEVRDPPLPDPPAGGLRVRVAVAAGPAFTFAYRDNLEALEAAGAELIAVDPIVDASLPEGCAGLYAGGGFPEVFAEALSANRPLLDDVAARCRHGLVTWAECGGLVWLARSLDGHRLAGVVPADARMTDRLTLGYRRATPRVDNPVVVAGAEVRGHEFHYSAVDPPGDAVEVASRFGRGRAGFAGLSLFAGYLHLHLGADPAPAARFVEAARVYAGRSRVTQAGASPARRS